MVASRGDAEAEVTGMWVAGPSLLQGEEIATGGRELHEAHVTELGLAVREAGCWEAAEWTLTHGGRDFWALRT